jgi:hypothetical protein
MRVTHARTLETKYGGSSAVGKAHAKPAVEHDYTKRQCANQRIEPIVLVHFTFVRGFFRCRGHFAAVPAALQK